MILGNTRTRRCGFCNVKTGRPTWNDSPEPSASRAASPAWASVHAVLTSVERADLPDPGASAFVGAIRQIRRQGPWCKVEILTPGLRGEAMPKMPLAKVMAERPDAFNTTSRSSPSSTR
jgi:lipoyl synthase